MPAATTPTTPVNERFNLVASTPFLLAHLAPVLIVVTGIGLKSVALLAFTFWSRMFCITAGYHRYFAHRSYRLGRVPQFLLAFAGTSAVQKGPLWWASHHRDHHRFVDTERDVHSPQRGFWWSHVGWILCDRYGATNTDRIKDFASYPELRFLDRHDLIAPTMLAIACYLVDGWRGVIVGFFLSTVLLWHATFLINSMAHVVGRRRYATADTSRNSFPLAVLTMGEGWHNNHHHYASSCRNGFFWWEWDPTYYLLRAGSLVGVVKEMKHPSPRVLAADRVRDASVDIGMFRLHWNRAASTLRAAATDDGLRQQARDLERFIQATMDDAGSLAKATRRSGRVRATVDGHTSER